MNFNILSPQTSDNVKVTRAKEKHLKAKAQ